MKKLLENKYLLYLVFFLSVITVFGFISNNNFSAVFLFALISVLAYYFSKNMIVILSSGLIGSHIVNMLNSNNSMFKTCEGYEGKEKDKDVVEGNTDSTEIKDAVTESVKSKKPKSKKDSFTNQALTPAIFDNLPNINNLLSKDDKSKATEKAYDLLENKIGDDNVKNIAGNTKELLGKQVQLMDQMKKITPILQQTMGLVNNLDLSSLTDMAEKVTELMPENLESIVNLGSKNN